MKIYKYPPKKVIIITEKRTGSSNLYSLAEYSELELVDNQPEYPIDYLREHQSEGWEIGLTIKEPHQRRLSGLQFIVDKIYREGIYDHLDDASTVLRNLIKDIIPNDNFKSNFKGYFDYTLNDGHLDWGTTCYYHWLVSNSIIPTLMFLNRHTYFDLHHFQNIYGYSTYTEYIENLLDQEPRAIETFKKSNHAEKSKNMIDNYYAPLTRTEIIRMFIYEVYKNTILEQTNIIYHDSLYDTQHAQYPNTILGFNEWENLETEMYHCIIRSLHKEDHEQIQASKIILKRVLTILLTCYNNHYGAKLQDFGRQANCSYPGKSLLRLIPDLWKEVPLTPKEIIDNI